MNDIGLIDEGWILYYDFNNKRMLIGNAMKWLEDLIIMGITHETIHGVLNKLEGIPISDQFDNIFGFADPSTLLCPEENEFYSTQLYRIEKKFWRKK